jgi:hypothetical protein
MVVRSSGVGSRRGVPQRITSLRVKSRALRCKVSAGSAVGIAESPLSKGILSSKQTPGRESGCASRIGVVERAVALPTKRKEVQCSCPAPERAVSSGQRQSLLVRDAGRASHPAAPRVAGPDRSWGALASILVGAAAYGLSQNTGNYAGAGVVVTTSPRRSPPPERCHHLALVETGAGELAKPLTQCGTRLRSPAASRHWPGVPAPARRSRQRLGRRRDSGQGSRWRKIGSAESGPVPSLSGDLRVADPRRDSPA